MEPLWKERRVFPVLALLSIAAILYLNFGDKFNFPLLYWQPKMSFITTNSTNFVIKGAEDESSPLYVNGWNSYWLMEESVWENSRIRVSKMLNKGSQMGMTVCRTWAFSDGKAPNSLQTSAGVFDERVFQGLDYVIVEARKHGIRLILSLVNNLNAFGGKDQYVKWAQDAGYNLTSSTDSFFSHPTIKDYYKNYIKAILTRKNSISGVKYSEEPAIFAWELMNEPRCVSSSSAPVLQSWITEMAAFIKSLDKNHLVTVGLEGFYGHSSSTEKSAVNPGKWAGLLGSDFIQNSAIQNIDFASAHAYPDNWIPNADLDEKASYLSHWVDSHVMDGENILKKPVLFTEIGSSFHNGKQGRPEKRELLLKTVYDKIYDSAKNKKAGAGTLIWQLIVEGMEHYGDEYSLVAWKHPSTYKLITKQSCRLSSLFHKRKSNRKL
ncbi:mannan endo-1,4-beta-mannosidase [Ranunculus cassubicifolius]